jgi:hypothetical protein
MKTKVVLFLVLNFLFGNFLAQLKFQKKIGSNANEIIYDMIKVSNGYVLAGTKNGNNTKDDMWAMKIDFSGNIVWSKTYGSTKDDRAFSIVKTNDNGFVLAGFSKGYITTGTDSFNVCITKIDSNGNWQWSKIFGGNAPDGAYSVKETNNGNLIICGFSESFGIGIRDMYVIRTDNNGNLLWSRAIGTPAAIDTAFSLIETSSGEIVIVGHSNKYGSTLTSVAKLSSSGNLIWYKEYDFTSYTTNKRRFTYDVIENNNGEYVICGSLGLGIINDGAPFLLKIDTSGTVIWGYSYVLNSGDCGAHSVVQTSDNGYIIGGFMGGNYSSALVKTNVYGQRQWSTCYNQSTNFISKVYSALPSNDGGYILVGYQIQGGGLSTYLIKTDSNGDSGCNNCYTFGSGTSTLTVMMNSGGVLTSTLNSIQSAISMTETNVSPLVITYCQTVEIEKFNDKFSIEIFPNPFSTHANLQTYNSLNNATLTIYNYFGQIVKEMKNITGHTITISRDNLSSGLYFVILTQDNQVITTKKISITD